MTESVSGNVGEGEVSFFIFVRKIYFMTSILGLELVCMSQFVVNIVVHEK